MLLKNCLESLSWVSVKEGALLHELTYPTITLVGSTRFPDVWKEAARELSLLGWIVHTVHLFGHQEGIDMNGSIKRMLDAQYLQKIDASHAILVLNKDGYIGLGAWDEIFYAIAKRKEIYFLEPLSDECRKEYMEVCLLECSDPVGV